MEDVQDQIVDTTEPSALAKAAAEMIEKAKAAKAELKAQQKAAKDLEKQNKKLAAEQAKAEKKAAADAAKAEKKAAADAAKSEPATPKTPKVDNRIVHVAKTTDEFSGMRALAYAQLTEGITVSGFIEAIAPIFKGDKGAGAHLLGIYLFKGLITLETPETEA